MSGSSKSVSRSPSISRSQRSVSVSRSPRYRRKRSRSRSVSVSRSPRRARDESPNGRSRYHRRRGSFSRSRSPTSRSPSQERKYRKTHRSRYGGRSPRHGHERSSHGSSRDRRGGHHEKEGYHQGGRFGGNFRGSGFNRRSGRGRDNFYSRPDFGIPNYDFDNPSNSGFMMHDYPPGHGAQFGNMGGIPHLVPGGPSAHHHGVPDGQNMANPRDLPTLVSINYFTDYMRWVNPESQMAEDEIYQAYTQYKKEFHYRQLRSFFNQHRNDNWFMDKYWNEAINDRLKEAYPQKVQLFDTFVKELQQGKFDSLNYDEPPSSTNGAQQEEEQDNESEPNIIFIKSIPPSISRHQVQELFSKFSGFQHLMLSDPNPLKKFHRLGWVIFEQGINVSKLLENELKSCCIDEFEFHLAPHKNKSIPRLTSPQFSNPARLRHDLSKVSKLTKELELYFAKAGQPDIELPNLFNGSEHINQRMDIILADRSPSPARSHEEGSQSDDIPISEVKKRLDLYLAYLRSVFHYCYYCYALCETSHDLIRKCSTKHYRGTDPKASTANKSSESWIKSFEQKIDLQIHGLNSQELENFGGQSLEKEIDLYASSQVLVIESNKCRCKLCNKLFKGAEFVEKHVKTKHKADFQEIIDEVQYFNNYIRDSQRVTPPSNVTPLGANTFQGHFPHSNFPPMNPGMIAPGPPGPIMHFGVNPEGMAPAFPMSMHPQPMAFQTMHPNPRYRGNRGFNNNSNNNNSNNNVNASKPSVPATRNLAPPDPRRQMRSYVDLDEPGPSADSTA